jgi:hypothetical protein
MRRINTRIDDVSATTHTGRFVIEVRSRARWAGGYASEIPWGVDLLGRGVDDGVLLDILDLRIAHILSNDIDIAHVTYILLTSG